MVARSGAASKDEGERPVEATKPARADARRNLDSLLRAAMEVFAESGVDAPVRDIAERAGVGVGTVYRHFPQRSDLIVAVLRTRMDECADAAAELSGEYAPSEALSRWMRRFVDFLSTKRGFAGALHSGDPAYGGLKPYFAQRMEPALRGLLERASDAGVVRRGVNAQDLLSAVATLCHGPGGEQPAYAREMVDLLVDGLKYGASSPQPSD